MDRRTIWAILLMMAIAIAPAIFMKKAPAGQGGSGAVTPSDSSSAVVRDSIRAPQASAESARAAASDSLPRGPAAPPVVGAAAPQPGSADDTVRVTSPLYTYGISTRGG